MNTHTSPSKKISQRFFLSAALLAFLSIFAPALHAEHEHDHILVTIDKDFGYDSDSEIHKVQVSTATRSYIVTLHGTHAAIADNIGRQARISISSNDTWTHFAIPNFRGAVRIHTVKRLVE